MIIDIRVGEKSINSWPLLRSS